MTASVKIPLSLICLCIALAEEDQHVFPVQSESISSALHEQNISSMHAQLSGCNCDWTKKCGPHGCADCKDDHSTCYNDCCGHSSPRRRHSPPSSPRRRRSSPGSPRRRRSSSQHAGTTRYWDCSGGACGGHDAVHCPNPHCSYPWGTPKCMPHHAAPRKISHHSGATVYATAAAGDPIWKGGAGCGKCFLLASPHGGKMIVRINNQCPGSSNPSCKNAHFDIAVPGFDYSGSSVSNVCSHKPRNCDPGVNSGVCAHGSIQSCKCHEVSHDKVLQEGCTLFKDLSWGDNPTVEMKSIGCPHSEHFVDSNETATFV